MGQILLTRPEPGLMETKRSLETAGYEVVGAPMTRIIAKKVRVPKANAYVVTSLRGVEHGLSKVENMAVPVFVVGPATAAAARSLGFDNIHMGSGTVESLVPVIEEQLSVGKGIVTHLSGVHLSHNISIDLTALGYKTQRVICYEAEVMKSLPESLVKGLDSNKISHALFYSARAVTIFERLLDVYDMREASKKIIMLAISDRVAKTAKLSWQSRLVAAEPTLEAMADLLDES